MQIKDNTYHSLTLYDLDVGGGDSSSVLVEEVVLAEQDQEQE